MKVPQSCIEIKIAVIGDEAVGKTAITRRYLGEPFTGYKPTLAADLYLKRTSYNVEPFGRCDIMWIIVDMSGRQIFEFIRQQYYRGAKAAIVVFDVSQPETFKSIPRWIKEFWKYSGGMNPFIIIGNKIDLRETTNCIPYEYGANYAKELSRVTGMPITYVETSARNGINIEKAFELLANTIITSLIMKQESREVGKLHE
ncbi:MAG: GTP-binding protein [Candidatus Korarchaeota archaeon]|nr:GTP-binding protein [Thermoproteota archaeon]